MAAGVLEGKRKGVASSKGQSRGCSQESQTETGVPQQKMGVRGSTMEASEEPRKLRC